MQSRLEPRLRATTARSSNFLNDRGMPTSEHTSAPPSASGVSHPSLPHGTHLTNPGIFLFGYDTGIGGGVLVLPTFAKDFGITGSKEHVADLQGNVVAILQGGAFFGAIIM